MGQVGLRDLVFQPLPTRSFPVRLVSSEPAIGVGHLDTVIVIDDVDLFRHRVSDLASVQFGIRGLYKHRARQQPGMLRISYEC